MSDSADRAPDPVEVPAAPRAPAAPAGTAPRGWDERARAALSPQAAAVLQAMREQVRARSEYRRRILARYPAPAAEVDVPPHGDAAEKAERMEARLAALEAEPAPASPGPGEAEVPTAGAPAALGPAGPRAVEPTILEAIGTVVRDRAVEAYEAEEALAARVRLVAPGHERRVAAAVRAPGVDSVKDAVERARAALGDRGLTRERDHIAALAGDAWSARNRLERATARAAHALELARTRPGERLHEEARVDHHEVLNEVERRRAEARRAGMAERARSERTVMPLGEPRMQEGGEYQDLRSIECLRCGTTAAREDGRSRLHTDGTPKGDAEPWAPRDGELCTPCWLSSAPMSVPELKLAQRQARLLEGTQVRYRPGRAGWEERAGEAWARDRAQGGVTPRIEARLDAPSPWVVQPSPAEAADRRMEALLEREALRDEALDHAQWDLPEGREAEWWDLKFSGMFAGEPEPRAEPSPEARLRMETARLAEAERRLRAIVGVEDPALRRVLETQAAVRLHLAQGSAVREAWEATRALPRPELRAAARTEVRERYLAPETAAHERRLREARGLVLPDGVPPGMQAAIRARQAERVLSDLDVPSLLQRTYAIATTAENRETARAAARLLRRLRPALEDTRVQGSLAAGRLAETARQDRGVFHSGLDEAVLPGERRGEAHERRIDRWLGRLERDGALAAGEVRTARDLAREAGELNPKHEVKEYTPTKAEGNLPWQLARRDEAIAAEVAAGGHTAPARVSAALARYRSEAAARGADVGDPFGEGLRERVIHAAARQAGFTPSELDRLGELQALAAAAGEDPRAFDQLMREAAAWSADPEHNNESARLREALEVRTRGGARLVFSAEDRELLARAERAATPYLEAFDGQRAAWLAERRPEAPDREAAPAPETPAHPAVEAAGAQVDPRLAEVAAQVAAMREFQRIDPAYQDALRQTERAEAILEATRETRDAAKCAWVEVERTVTAQFSNPEKLLERIREMDAAEVRRLAETLRTNPLALTANHPRTGKPPRIPGINAAGAAERLEPHLRSVRAPGLRGLAGEVDRSATERQARVAAVALETWAEARSRGEETRAWAAPQLGLPADAPLARVVTAAERRLGELTEEHAELVRSWRQLAPAPTLAQLERRLQQMDPETAKLARGAFPELARAPHAPAAASPRPQRSHAAPALAL